MSSSQEVVLILPGDKDITNILKGFKKGGRHLIPSTLIDYLRLKKQVLLR